jgi:uncharacterized protein (TIGR03083 family)
VTTSLSVDAHIDAIRSAVRRLASIASEVPESTRVPTCPRWDLRALVAHVVMVHAWAAASVRGHDGPPSRTQTEIRRSGEDVVALLLTGADDLVEALASAADDARAMVFLLDAPPPRAFWARRQAHETTIHAADALSAALGRPPTSIEATIPRELAVDGLDELLCGFVPRGASRWPVDRAFRLAVSPTDADSGWLLDVGPDSVSTSSGATGDAADCRFSGTASGLYLALWNRGGEVAESGRPGTLDTWRSVQRVRWS